LGEATVAMSSVAPSALRSVEDPVSEKTRIYRLKRPHPDRWGVLVGGVALLISLPLLAILVYLTQEGPEWSHLVETVLPTYVSNTLILVTGVSLVAILFSVLPAYLVSYYEFPRASAFSVGSDSSLGSPNLCGRFCFL
jgi:ABC-type Fe3+ transport system permease subunit